MGGRKEIEDAETDSTSRTESPPRETAVPA